MSIIMAKLATHKNFGTQLYVEINQQKLLEASCFEWISNFVQLYYQTGVNQGRNWRHG